MQNGEKMDIQVLIRKLVSYGVQTGLVPEEDVIYTTNRLLELFELEDVYKRQGYHTNGILTEIVNEI